MSPVFDVSGSDERDPAIEAAHAAVGEGKLVVLPTDTVYGVGADPFNPDGVAALLAASGDDLTAVAAAAPVARTVRRGRA